MCVQASRLTGSLGCVITGPWLLGAFLGPRETGSHGQHGQHGQEREQGRSNDNSALGVEIITSGLFADSISTHQSRRAGSGAYPGVHVPTCTWQF